jgi:hypothetical protein
MLHPDESSASEQFDDSKDEAAPTRLLDTLRLALNWSCEKLLGCRRLAMLQALQDHNVNLIITVVELF